MLRLRSVIDYKASKLRSYIDDGVISSAETTVIAISGAKLEFRYQEGNIPYAARVVFGIGQPVLHLDRRSKKVVGQSVDPQQIIHKSNNAPIRIDPF